MKALLPFTLIVFLAGCTAPQKDKWQYLFDGSDLSKWDTYLGPKFEPGVTWDNLDSQQAAGWNHDSLGVFSIVNLDDENVLRISGQIWGAIVSKQAFENYHLQLQFRWGQKKWYPRDSTVRDSGLLYHSVEKERDPFWLRSQEFQIQEGDCGDYWGVAGARIDIRAQLNEDSIYQYDPAAPSLSFFEGSEYGRHAKKYPDGEKTSGEWNTIDLYCLKGTSYHIINGTLTMILENSRHKVDSTIVPLTKGRIQLQSEAAEVYYKSIRIRSIDKLPIL